MYQNLLIAMEKHNILFSKIAGLLETQTKIIINICNGKIKKDFSLNEALLIKYSYFPDYDVKRLFQKHT